MKIGIIGGSAAIASLALTGCFDLTKVIGKDNNDIRIEQAAKREIKQPVNPDSFETKSKVTQ